MNRGIGFKSGQLSAELQAIAATIRALAQSCQGDSLALVALLRSLEDLHREIREGLFQAALPDNRQQLYKLLKDIETEGGWPYIERMKLQSFLANLPSESREVSSDNPDAIKEIGATFGDQGPPPRSNASTNYGESNAQDTSH